MKKTLLLFAFTSFVVQWASSHDIPLNKSLRSIATAAPSAYSVNGITVAGGYGKGSASNQFNNPQGIFVDQKGNIYVADTYNSRVQKWTPGALNGITVAGGNGPGPAANQLYNPSKIFVDTSGNIYIADQYNNRIQKWPPGASKGITVAGGNGPGAGSNQLAMPYDVFVDKIGDMFISDMNNNRIQRWSPGADTGVTVAGGNGRGSKANQLDKPKGIYVEDIHYDYRSIHIADANNARIQYWPVGVDHAATVAGGKGQGSKDTQFFDPEGVYLDQIRQLFVTDPSNNRIQKWIISSKAGITVAGGKGSGSTAEKLSSPSCVFIDKIGNIYVSDRNNNRVQKFTLADNESYLHTGIIVAGGNSLGYARGVTVDRNGNVFVGDVGNRSIQKWAPGAISGTIVVGGYVAVTNAPGRTPPIYPDGLCLDTSGNIYVANSSNIVKFAPGSSVGTIVAGDFWGGAGASQLFWASDVFVDWKGNIFISDDNNRRVQKWAPGALYGVTVVKPATTNRDYRYTAICGDAFGNIYVADNRNTIQKWAPGATSGKTVAGGNGGGNAANQFDWITGISVDASGNLYVSDHSNYRIQKWRPGAKEGITVAGGYSDQYGGGSEAGQLRNPQKIFVDKQRNIYVAEGYHCRVQKFVPREITTCPDDVFIKTTSCNDKVVIQWPEPSENFPATLYLPPHLDARAGTLMYLGTFSGHGYYKSDKLYSWAASAVIAGTIGYSSVPGHLVTVTSAAENDFIYNQIKSDVYAPWIGLFNAGLPGRFRWVNVEPTVYTNWAPGEPNNAGGGIFNMKEPYVQMSNVTGKWNNQGDDNSRFITEFDAPVLKYRQISGPQNRSSQKAGVYMVCYEKTNVITDRKDTCCFNVFISCDMKTTSEANYPASALSVAVNDLSKGLHLSISPNPSSSSFRLQLTGTSGMEQVNVQISDMSGRIVETSNKPDSKQTLTIGKNLRPGTYFVRVTQGAKSEVVKIVKR